VPEEVLGNSWRVTGKATGGESREGCDEHPEK